MWEFSENRRRDGRTLVMGVNETTFTRTAWICMTLWQKKTLIKICVQRRGIHSLKHFQYAASVKVCDVLSCWHWYTTHTHTYTYTHIAHTRYTHTHKHTHTPHTHTHTYTHTTHTYTHIAHTRYTHAHKHTHTPHTHTPHTHTHIHTKHTKHTKHTHTRKKLQQITDHTSISTDLAMSPSFPLRKI